MFLERQVGLPEPSLFHTELQRELLRWDTDDAAAEEQMLAGKMSSKRAADQRKVYDEIIAELLRWRSAPRTTKVHEAAPQYFVDAAQGRGKTTLAQRLIARLRAEPDAVVLVVASTGLAALNYKGATTAHALFRIPVKDPDDDSDVLQCAIGRSFQRAEIIRAASGRTGRFRRSAGTGRNGRPGSYGRDRGFNIYRRGILAINPRLGRFGRNRRVGWDGTDGSVSTFRKI